MNKQWMTAILVGLALMFPLTIALAQGPMEQDGQRRGLGRLVYGVITSIESGQIVIEPQIPPEMADRMAAAGRTPPELPAEVVLGLDESTKYFNNGAAAAAGTFGVGDTVVIVTDQGAGENRVAKKIADPETAREYIKQQMGEGGPGMRGGEGQGMGRGEGRGMRGGEGQGMGRGEGRGGERRGRPVFGEIIAISDGQITIRPEIPEFVLAKMAEHGMEPPTDMPAEVILSLGDRTHYVQNSELVDENPFDVGDRVAIMAGRGDGDRPTAYLLSDWASAEAKLAELGHQRGERGDGGNRPAGKRPGRNRDRNR